MLTDLVGTILSMKVDIYVQQDTQDPDTGALKKLWVLDRTIPCFAKGNISNSSSGRGTDRQQYGTRYKDVESIQVRTAEFISHREKLVNIRSEKDQTLWFELNYPTNTPTVFEVFGNTPIMDPFGSVLGYNLMCQRSENQTID
jgi:hypothetical protein